MSNGLFKKYNNILLIIIAIINFGITCILQYITYKKGMKYDVWYNFLTLFICGICIFELFIRVKNRKSKNNFIKATEYISKISLGIFFLHEIFLKLLIKYIEKLDLRNFIETIILFMLSLICSIIFIFITSKIKIIEEKIFLIKD